jgi:hypothetical protein
MNDQYRKSYGSVLSGGSILSTKRQKHLFASLSLIGILILGIGLSTPVLQTAAAADSSPPTLAITKPADGSMVRSTVTVTGTAYDSSGVSLVEIKVNGGSYAKATPKTTGDWSTWTHSLTFTTSGWKSIIAKATDKAGNQAWFKIAVYSDLDAPTVQISSPSPSSTVTAGTVKASGTASDYSDMSGIKVVEVKVGGGSYITATPKAAGDWSTWTASVSISTEGSYTMTARATDKAGNMQWHTVYFKVSSSSSLDKFGIKELFPTKTGGNEWYVNMNDPTSDSMFRNLPSMTKQSDGSWQVDGGTKGQVRMEAWSPSNEKWVNVEITGYAKMVSGSNELIQWYSRGGHHTSSNECLGSAVKARLYGDGEARWVKEINHPAYTSNRGSVQATNTPLEDRWIGFKAVMYNFVQDGKTYVRMQSYIDDDVTDSNGNLVIKNNWKLASVVEDKGGWATGSSDFNSGCAPLNKDSTQQYRQTDEILNKPGGTDTQNIAAFRSDDLTWNWKYLSVREIKAP